MEALGCKCLGHNRRPDSLSSSPICIRGVFWTGRDYWVAFEARISNDELKYPML
jgi:hypothetical protein